MSTRHQISVTRQPPRTGVTINQRPQDHTCQYLDDLKAANAHIRRMEEERDHYKQEIASLKRELSAAKTLAEDRGRKLSTTQDPTTTVHADRLSIPEACETVHTLNKVILDASDYMAESMIPHQYPEAQRTAAMSSVIKCLGPNLPSILIAESRQNTPIDGSIVKTIVLFFLIYHCRSLLADWCPGNGKQSAILEEIYQALRSTVDQSVFGPWRALAFSHIRIGSTAWRQHMLTSFEEVLAVAGWKLASDTESRKFEQLLEFIFDAAKRARSAVGEMVTSADLRVTFANGGTAYKIRDSDPDDFIAGTTSLGVNKVTKERTTHVFDAQIIRESALREWIEHRARSGKETEPGAAHTAILKVGPPMPTNYVDGVEQRATPKHVLEQRPTRKPAQG